MASPRNPPNEFPDRRARPIQHYDRNRIFSSTTTDHYKSKLAQLGIQKDLREVLERKRLQREQDKNSPNYSVNWSNECSETSPRKVRFQEERVPIRRSKSFTSGTTKNPDDHYKDQSPPTQKVLKENVGPQNYSKNFKGRKIDFVDLHKPTNIKIELETTSGGRKCTVDSNVSIASVKCDLRNSRRILKHAEIKDVAGGMQITETEVKNEKTGNSSGYQRSFNKKNRKYKKDNYEQNNDRPGFVGVKELEEDLSNLSIAKSSMEEIQGNGKTDK